MDKIVADKSAVITNKFEINPNRIINLVGYTGLLNSDDALPSCKIALTPEEAVQFLRLLERSNCPSIHTRRSKELSERVVDHNIVGIIQTMIQVMVQDRKGGVEGFCGELDVSGFSELSDTIRKDWVKYGVKAIGVSGYFLEPQTQVPVSKIA